ncbi:SapC family protein [Psychrosphaera sp. B3R10]|uniref:SapC family protein n=1 Tax=unclassified Psychrosphaera TaxID=2641570 RepID=UPI001C07F258|nr:MULTISPECIES: SapC family protein [unclassified Psychrosphaera]MBU2883955.1 SapC family protein [Psychrosphaera sp. I2R16]MBU2990360.1 SapC family protein [Psychrosphaera sp. B3R10]
MANHVLLNNVTHKDLKIDPRYSAAHGNNIASTIIFPNEIEDIQKEYPILFRKDPETNKFLSTVILGFEKNENLFLDTTTATGWNAEYVPAIIAREPFLIGYQDQSADGGDEKAPVIHIDMDSTRINISDGTALFLEHGGNSQYLENSASSLKRITEGAKLTNVMFAAFEELSLIEPITIEFTLDNGEKYQLNGNYTISEEKLQNLDGASLEKLNRSGFLQSAFLIIASISNIQKLINLKNQLIE